MSSALEALDAIRDGREAKKKPPWVRAPFAPTEIIPWVLAFDPSLASTGWAVLSPRHPFVHEVGTIKTDPLDGEEGNIQRGVAIFGEARTLIARIAYQYRGSVHLVHEAPPAGGSTLHRPDSIKAASLAVRCAAAVEQTVVLPPVSDLTVKKRLVGTSKGVEKSDIKAAITEFWPHLPLDGMRWNEHIRDAVGVGIIALERTP